MMAFCNDNSFGPAVPSTCSAFDFTLLFQQAVLLTPLCTVFIAVSTIRVYNLRHRALKVTQSGLGHAKIATTVVYIVLKISVLVTSTLPSAPVTRFRIAAPALEIVSGICLAVLSRQEHTRAVAPSTIICIYLLSCTLLDGVQTRTLWIRYNAIPLSILVTISLAIGFILLCLEMRNKINLSMSQSGNYSPESTSGIFSKWLFWWLNPLLAKGFRTQLAIKDLMFIDTKLLSKSLNDGVKAQLFVNLSQRKTGLSKFLVLFLKKPLFFAVPARLLQTAFTFVQPLLIHRIIEYVENKSNSEDTGYGLIAATALTFLGAALSTACYKHQTYRFITGMRGSLIAIIYDKTLRLKSEFCDDSAALTLTNTDIDRIAAGFSLGHEIWASPIDVSIALYLLERQTGWPCIAPMILTILASAASAFIARFVGYRQKMWLEAVQERVTVTGSFLQKMRAVKMMGMIDYMAADIFNLRAIEIKGAKRYLRIDALINVISGIPTLFSALLTFALYAFATFQGRHGIITSAQVFSTLSIISLMTAPSSLLLSALPALVGSITSLKRIEAYLLSEDHHDQRRLVPSHRFQHRTSETMEKIMKPPANIINKTAMPSPIRFPLASINRGTFAYSGTTAMILSDMNIDFMPGEKIIVTGPVGSGKSTLLKILLGEVALVSGDVTVCTNSLAFCSRDPWLINSTIRENILMGSRYCEKKYNDVVTACDLWSDFSGLAAADLTITGLSGLNLSGGQRQRIAIARALYSDADLLLFDDVLSCLDATTETLVHDKIFGSRGLLKTAGKCIILVTQKAQHFEDADTVITLSANGNGAEIARQPPRLGDFLEVHEHELDTTTIFENNTNEELSDGSWSEEAPSFAESNLALLKSGAKGRDSVVWSMYFRRAGWHWILIFTLLLAIFTFCSRFPQVWLGYWANASSAAGGYETNVYYISILFLICTIASIFFGLAILFLFQVMVPRSATKLHEELLHCTIRCSYTFFSGLSVGSILNRFSQDMSLVDIELPSDFLETAIYAMTSIAQAGLIFSGSKYIVPALPAVIIILYLLQWCYLKTARQLRHLDLESKSPLYAHLMETCNGLQTIRAAGWVSLMHGRFLNLLDLSQRPYYLLYCIQRWLTLVLSLLVGGVATLLVSITVTIGRGSVATNIGVALLNVITFNQTLTNLIIKWTSLETSLGAIDRVRTFTQSADVEDSGQSAELTPAMSPKSKLGTLQFANVNVQYNINSNPPVLRELSFTLPAGAKVAICGRTGSGKSTLVLSVLRMVNLSSGYIALDGEDISRLSCTGLRRNIATLPQEGVVLSGTARYNLNLGQQFPDSVAIQALQDVGLWDVLESRNGLDTLISASVLSNGQQQLFCAARAILNKDNRRLLILDEATSSLDRDCAVTLMNALTRAFERQTVLAVTHQLEFVRDFDLVLVLDEGQLKEMGSPTELLKKADSLFKALWDQQVGMGADE